jgi:O-antigen/teichoic acid export membrane protein
VPGVASHAAEQPQQAAALGRIARVGALFAASNVARGALALATSVVVARHLGPDAFGRWALCAAWASMLTFVLDLGFGVLLTRDVAADRARAGRLLGGALAARIVLFVPVAAVFVATARWVGLGEEAFSMLSAMLLLALAGIAYGSVAAVFRAWPERIAAILTVETAGAVLLLAGAWTIVANERSVLALLGMAAGVQIVQLVAAMMLWSEASGPGRHIVAPTILETWRLARRAFPFAVSGVVANIQERLGPMLLGAMASTTDVASFGAAWRIGSAARMLPQAALGGGLPVLSEETARGGHRSTRARFERLLGIFGAVAAPLIALLAVPLVRITYGEDFSVAASSLVWIGLGLWPFVVNSARKVGLYADGRERGAVMFSAIALAIQVVACAALIPRFGAPGAALAIAAGEAAVWWPLRSYARARS